MGSVTVGEYWEEWLRKIVASGIRKSKAEIVEEGLKTIQYQLDRMAQEMDDMRAIAEQKVEGSE